MCVSTCERVRTCMSVHARVCACESEAVEEVEILDRISKKAVCTLVLVGFLSVSGGRCLPARRGCLSCHFYSQVEGSRWPFKPSSLDN